MKKVSSRSKRIEDVEERSRQLGEGEEVDTQNDASLSLIEEAKVRDE